MVSPVDSTRKIVSHKHVLSTEILSVTAAMRKNARWATGTHFVNSRDSGLGSNLGLRISTPSSNALVSQGELKSGDLMGGFQELKRTIRDVDDLRSIPLTRLLAPFFAIIRSPLSTGPITSSALSSLHNLFVCGLISSDYQDLDVALSEFSNTVSHCKFEASDSSGDEVVLLKIMTVIHDCLCGKETGPLLGDVEVCEMLETVLTTCCQMRLSEILRRFAENTMHALVRTVFSRLHILDPEVEEAKLAAFADESQENEIKMNVASQEPTHPPADSSSPSQEPEEQEPNEETALLTNEGAAPVAIVDMPTAKPPNHPAVSIQARSEYGLPSILELMRVLVNVLDPNDQQHTDSTRLVALGVLNAAFEESGHRIAKFPSLEALILDPGCKFLFQLARSENMSILHAALRAISALLETMRPRLKLQQELFLAFSIDRLAPPPPPAGSKAVAKRPQPSSRPGTPSTPSLGPIDEPDSEKGTATPPRVLVAPARGETRDLILETLSHISRHPSFMVDLYTNYDCDSNCENLFERLTDFLTKAVYSSHYTGMVDDQMKNAQYLCLDILLAFVNDMATRAEGGSESWPPTYPTPEALLQTKSQKKLILSGASIFNTKPRNGIAFLEENKLIYNDVSPENPKERSLASFLKSCTRLDKRLVGDYISRQENIEVLKAFMGLFDFKDKPIAEAMREMLESFRLPGEAQQIDRISEIFSSYYFAAKPAGIRTEDAVYVLAFSIIMLNTDQHNPQVRGRRMTIEDYQKNLRGVNDGGDFAPEFLQTIFDSIRKREIVMPEEHTGQLGFEYAWKELLLRARQTGELLMCNTSLFDVDMFKSVWKPVISSIAWAFIHFEDDYVIQRSVAGFRQCATLAGQFQLPDVFDFVVVSLSQATSLLSEHTSAQVPNFPVVDVEGQSVTVSNLSVKFGTNFKGQLAAVVLFNIVNGNGNALREGWTQIFEMFQNLFLHSLLPVRMLQMEDFLGGVSMIPLRGTQPQRPAGRGDGGLLSALSSYLMTPYGASTESLVPEATDSDVENTLCTIDCITSCRLDELYSQIMHLDIDALVSAIRALEALAHERTVTKLNQTDEAAIAAQQGEEYKLPYDPASVFLLETMVSITCQTAQHIEDLWPIVFEHLSALLSASANYSLLLIERAVVGLLRLCLILAQRPSLHDQIYISLDLLSGLPSTIANSVAEQVIAGVVLLVRKHREVISSQTEWNLVFAVIRSTTSHPEAARHAFDLIIGLASDGPEQHVNTDNFSGLLTLFDDFATSTGLAIENQQRHGRRQEPATPGTLLPSIERGTKAIEVIVSLKKFVGPLIELTGMPHDQAWRQLCLPLLMVLGRQSTNASREVRHSAISQLQRFLLAPLVLFENPPNARVEDIFNRVIFPLLDDLLKPQINQRDPPGMAETRLRASALLCKTFMHFEVRESQYKADIRLIWIQILDLLDRLMQIQKGDQLYEAVPESLKNVVLVMNAAGMLVPPPIEGEDVRTEQQRTMWNITNERIDRFLPKFLNEVIPRTVPAPTRVPIPETPAPSGPPKPEEIPS